MTGGKFWNRLDRFLSAMAYGIAVAGFVCIASLLSLVLWAHWRLYE